LDLKPENVLLNQEKGVQLCDLTQAEPVTSLLKKRTGTPAFMAPENYMAHRQKDGYSGVLSDIFSLGVILFLMSFKSVLWTGGADSAPDDRNRTYRRLRDRGIEFMLEKHQASSACDFERLGSLVDLLGGLLAIDSSKRFQSVE